MVPRCLCNQRHSLGQRRCGYQMDMAKSNLIVGVLDHSPLRRVGGKRAKKSDSGRYSRQVDTVRNWPCGRQAVLQQQ